MAFNLSIQRQFCLLYATTPGFRISKSLFTSAHLRLISTYSLVQILRALMDTYQIFNNTDHHGISYVFHRLS